MSVYFKPCAKCRRTRAVKTTPARKRKACPDCRWIAIAPPSMGRRSLGAFLTKEDAERAERDALSAKDRGVELSPRKVTVCEILERFIADRRSKQRAMRTIDRYEGLVELSIVPHIGSLPLAKLTPGHVSAWLATLQEKGGARIAKVDRKPVLRDGSASSSLRPSHSRRGRRSTLMHSYGPRCGGPCGMTLRRATSLRRSIRRP